MSEVDGVGRKDIPCYTNQIGIKNSMKCMRQGMGQKLRSIHPSLTGELLARQGGVHANEEGLMTSSRESPDARREGGVGRGLLAVLQACFRGPTIFVL
jgi:hypothetical protein